MDELVEWLRVQLDEDERVAKAATSGGPWRIDGMSIRGNTRMNGTDVLVVGHTWPREADHMVRHDPCRVLRDVEAARERLAFIERLANHTDSPEDSVTTISMNALRTVAVNELLWAEVLPYSDRPGYREEWKP